MPWSFWSKLEPKDIVAIISLMGAFVLIALGIDSEMKAVPAVIIGLYFGIKIGQKK